MFSETLKRFDMRFFLCYSFVVYSTIFEQISEMLLGYVDRKKGKFSVQGEGYEFGQMYLALLHTASDGGSIDNKISNSSP